MKHITALLRSTHIDHTLCLFLWLLSTLHYCSCAEDCRIANSVTIVDSVFLTDINKSSLSIATQFATVEHASHPTRLLFAFLCYSDRQESITPSFSRPLRVIGSAGSCRFCFLCLRVVVRQLCRSHHLGFLDTTQECSINKSSLAFTTELSTHLTLHHNLVRLLFA